MWKEENSGWYTKLRTDVEKVIVRRCLTNAFPVSGKSLPIGRHTLLALRRYYHSKKDGRDAMDAMENRAIINMCYHAIGRSGEVGLASWNGSYFDKALEVPFLDWNEMKTGHQNLMTIICDAEHWENDVIHSFAAFFAFGGGSNGYSQVMDLTTGSFRR